MYSKLLQKDKYFQIGFFRPLLFAVIFAFFVGCAKKASDPASNSSTDADSFQQQAGDIMGSADEMGGSGGSYASFSSKSDHLQYAKNELKIFEHLKVGAALARDFSSKAQKEILVSSIFLPQAQAAACSQTSTFSTCSSNVITRTFGGCTVGSGTFNGTVTLNFNDGNVNAVCTMDSNGDTIERNPNFTITGPQGGQFAATKTGTIGQRLTRVTATTYNFSNDGIRRVLSYNGSTLADFTTVTTADIGISGTNRNGRVMNGGTLRVTNNISGKHCDLSPANLTWGSTCSCAISGSWNVSCSDSATGTLTVTGCGAGTWAVGAESTSVTFNRCSSL